MPDVTRGTLRVTRMRFSTEQDTTESVKTMSRRPSFIANHARPSTPWVIAHRGASASAPESTEAAIRAAVALKVDMVELDVQLTSDDRLVIFHDDRLERTTNGQGRLAAWRYPALGRLDCGSWFSPRFAGSRILLVSQALRLIPPWCRVNLELKGTGRSTTMIRQVVRCLHWTRSIGRVVISAFHPPLLARLKTACPRIATALLCRRQPVRALRQAISLHCVALHPHASLIQPAVVAQTHAAGLRLHTWTVDGAEEAQRLLRMGIDGLITNDPERLLKFARTRTSETA
ncbi:MAG: glycerophosphodiester phosphodiesterase [Candidatus Omnitrophica bacterium]|nr:glycerophosphodiester phosphodiesterase [Candidatus Omnitrophota bacterium]